MLLTFGETALRLAPPGGGQLETAPGYDVAVTGAESNAAVAAARLGAEAVWCSKLPDSPLGRRVAGRLRDHGVTTDVVWGDGGRVGVRYGERASAPRPAREVDDRAGAAVASVAPEELPLGRVDGAQLLYTSAATMALSTALVRTTATLLKRANQAGVRTAFGLVYRDAWTPEEARETVTGLFPAVDVLVAPERDLRRVLGRDGTPQEMAHGVATEFDFAQVVINREERGGVVWKDATVHERRPPATDVVDPHGATDAFAGAYLSRLLDGADAPEALADAVAVASLTRTVEAPVAPFTRSDVASVRERMTDEE